MTVYTTRDEAIQFEIVNVLGDEYAPEHDVEKIADEVLESVGEGTSYGWRLAPEYDEHDAFWTVVQNNAL